MCHLYSMKIFNVKKMRSLFYADLSIVYFLVSLGLQVQVNGQVTINPKFEERITQESNSYKYSLTLENEVLVEGKP
jgi:hypothetical protein